jgi:tripartite-type tricarboxylate transporter receptor subunit TctC
MRLMHLGSLAVFALVPAMHAAAQAQYPVKPVRLIIPFPPGGSSDLLGRIVGQKLGETLGQQVIVENRPGAAGNIGAEAVAKSPPDGYTVLLGNVDQAISMSFYDKLNYHLVRDLVPTSGLAFTPLASRQVDQGTDRAGEGASERAGRIVPRRRQRGAPGGGTVVPDGGNQDDPGRLQGRRASYRRVVDR